MKTSKIVKNVIYFVIMSTFFFDSYFKLAYLLRESDLLRSKYQNLQDFLNRTFSVTLPVNIGTVTDYAPYILSGYAFIEATIAFLVVLGFRSLSMLLIIMTILQSFVMHNPYYRNTTEIDR
jgi:hypothetical protein